jgi:hypothetical protein
LSQQGCGEARVFPRGFIPEERQSRQPLKSLACECWNMPEMIRPAGTFVPRPEHRDCISRSRKPIGDGEERDFGSPIVSMEAGQREGNAHSFVYPAAS